MPYPAYLSIDDYSDLWQNGCVPLAWLALLRDAEPLLNSTASGFGGWRTTPWEATDSLDRTINVLQRDPYFWAYFNVLSLLLDEIQQVPTEEDITIDASEFASISPEREEAVRGSSEQFREMLRMLHRGERDAALQALRDLSAALNLDKGLPFTGTLAGDIAALGGPAPALQELTWSIMGEMYDGPEERTEWYTAQYYLENFWGWINTGEEEQPEEVDEIEVIPEVHRNGNSPDL
jgi:hypothetical protein